MKTANVGGRRLENLAAQEDIKRLLFSVLWAKKKRNKFKN